MTVQPSHPGDPTPEAPHPPADTAAPQSTAEPPFADAGFGSRLRAVREARGLDLESCGQSLHLPVKVLRQLESDDRRGIDYQVYLTGYISKYARYLGVDEEEIQAEVARIKRSDTVQASPELVVTGGIPRSRYLLQRYATAATYVVLTVVIAVPIVWLGMRGTLSTDVSRLAPLDASPVATQQAAAPSRQPGTVPAAAASTVGVAGDIAASLPPPKVVPPQVDQPLMASMMPVPDLSGAPAPASKANTDAADVGSGSHSLVLTLDNNSWVEVTTGDGDRLEYSLLPAGTVKTYRSDEPMEVRIGNADGAKVSIDGQPVALDDYRHANVAHFRVAIADGKAAPAGA